MLASDSDGPGWYLHFTRQNTAGKNMEEMEEREREKKAVKEKGGGQEGKI